MISFTRNPLSQCLFELNNSAIITMLRGLYHASKVDFTVLWNQDTNLPDGFPRLFRLGTHYISNANSVR